MEATARNLRVDGIKIKVCREIGVFEQALCEVVDFLPNCILRMNILSD